MERDMFIVLALIVAFVLWCLIESRLAESKGKLPTLVFALTMSLGLCAGIYLEKDLIRQVLENLRAYPHSVQYLRVP